MGPRLRRWEETTLKDATAKSPERRKEFTTVSGLVTVRTIGRERPFDFLPGRA